MRIFRVPEGLDLVLWTKPYYRSSYVMAYRGDRGYDLRSLDAPVLQRLRIGVHVNTPLGESLARRGLLDNVSTYSLFFDPRGDRDRPRKLLDDLLAGTWTSRSRGVRWPATPPRRPTRRSNRSRWTTSPSTSRWALRGATTI